MATRRGGLVDLANRLCSGMWMTTRASNTSEWERRLMVEAPGCEPEEIQIALSEGRLPDLQNFAMKATVTVVSASEHFPTVAWTFPLLGSGAVPYTRYLTEAEEHGSVISLPNLKSAPICISSFTSSYQRPNPPPKLFSVSPFVVSSSASGSTDVQLALAAAREPLAFWSEHGGQCGGVTRMGWTHALRRDRTLRDGRLDHQHRSGRTHRYRSGYRWG